MNTVTSHLRGQFIRKNFGKIKKHKGCDHVPEILTMHKIQMVKVLPANSVC